MQRRLLIGTFFVVLGLFLLTTQNSKLGFEPGHHGWVSSHILAISQHAYAHNGFVGYAVQSRDDSGAVEYHYFDRYPVPFSAGLHLLLQSNPNAFDQIYLARQVMNLIFLANIIVAYLLLRRLTGSVLIALSAALLAFSGYYFMFFRDMVHFDQPAVLGVTLLLYGIAIHHQTGRAWPLYAATIAALSMGRAYPAMAVLGVWLLLEAWHMARAASWRLRAATAVLYRSHVPRAFLLGLILSSSYLAYNVVAEASIRDVKLTETSIVGSALRRIGASESFAQKERSTPLTWSAHARTQAERLVVGAIPYPFWVPDEYKRGIEYLVRRAGPLAIGLALAVGAGLIGGFVLRQSSAGRRLWLLVVLSGFAWLVPMKNLAIPHQYTTVYHLGLFLTLFVALISLLSPRYRLYVLVASAVIFVSSTLSVNAIHDATGSRVNPVTADFQEIRTHLAPKANVFLFAPDARRLDGSVAIVEGAPYAAAFYLPDQYFSTLAMAEYVVARVADGPCPPTVTCELLTPRNESIVLSRIRRPE